MRELGAHLFATATVFALDLVRIKEQDSLPNKTMTGGLLGLEVQLTQTLIRVTQTSSQHVFF